MDEVDNPDPETARLLNVLLQMRLLALKDLTERYRLLEEKTKDENQKYEIISGWIKPFYKISFEISNNYPIGRDYLLPVASAFRDLIKYKILNTEEGSSLHSNWEHLLIDINMALNLVEIPQ